MMYEFKCQCDKACLRSFIVRNYDSERIELEIDGNAIVLDQEQIAEMESILFNFLNELLFKLLEEQKNES